MGMVRFERFVSLLRGNRRVVVYRFVVLGYIMKIVFKLYFHFHFLNNFHYVYYFVYEYFVWVYAQSKNLIFVGL